MSRDEIKKILSECKTIAVIGLSREPEKESYEVSEYLQNHGFRIIPVNPFADEVL
ncbi:MAG TPA: CoA-binding protein, partial [Candidatus Bathyarchaeia archaeon]|nr:CoA-binding protein [Candidatus Bathyarchaeia archaeon]